jgi:DtxR family Mn-dependent transcriptional regulator
VAPALAGWTAELTVDVHEDRAGNVAGGILFGAAAFEGPTHVEHGRRLGGGERRCQFGGIHQWVHVPSLAYRTSSIGPRRRARVNDLVDTTEMYLRTILELEEEGVVPLRARIAERLHQSGPTVSQTVSRMERDGLLTIMDQRHLQLTEGGRAYAIAVMRKHRLAELLLVNVIGLPYEEAHEEACRWEHVMCESVVQRVYELLGRPTRSPYGNPIPGLAKFDASAHSDSRTDAERNLAFPGLAGTVVVSRICESVQTDADVLRQLHIAGVDPGAKVMVAQERDGVRIDRDGDHVRLPREVASRVFVTVG